MKNILLSSFIVLLTAFAAKAQTAQNLVLFPSPTTMNSLLNVQYDLYNNTAAPITGVVSTSVKINNHFKGVMHSQPLASPLLPRQSVTISFGISVTPIDFGLGNNVIIIWPNETVTDGGDVGAGGLDGTGPEGSATSTVWVTQAN